jgi:hypothetical protein
VIEKVEVHKYANPSTYIGKDQGRIIGGRVNFKSADPSHPVVFINQPGLSIQNQKTKRRMLFYDTTRKILIKPSSLGGGEGTIDDMSVAVQAVLAAESDTAKELGVIENNKYWSLLGFAAFVMAMLLGMIGAYLMIPHTAATTTSPGSTSVLGLGVVPNSTVHIGSTSSNTSTSPSSTKIT